MALSSTLICCVLSATGMYGGPLATRSISVLTDSEAPRQRMGAVESCMNPRSPTDLCASNDVHSPSQDQVKSVRQSWEDSGREMEGGSGAHGPPRKQVKSVTQYPSWDDSTPWEMQGRSPTRRGGVVLVRYVPPLPASFAGAPHLTQLHSPVHSSAYTSLAASFVLQWCPRHPAKHTQEPSPAHRPWLVQSSVIAHKPRFWRIPPQTPAPERS